MEFDLDSENIEIILKEDKHKSSEDFTKRTNPNNLISPEIPNQHLTKFEILLKLEDFYFIENIKIIGDSQLFNLNKIKFQNFNNNIWENAYLFNHDSSEVILNNQE